MSGLLEAVARFFSFEGGIDPNRAGHGAPKARWGVGTLEAFARCLHASSTPGALRGHSKSGARRRARCAQSTLGRISRTTICHICWNKIVSKKLFEQNFIFQKKKTKLPRRNFPTKFFQVFVGEKIPKQIVPTNVPDEKLEQIGLAWGHSANMNFRILRSAPRPIFFGHSAGTPGPSGNPRTLLGALRGALREPADPRARAKN